MELRAAIQERHSIRGFTMKQVERRTVEDVLTLATRAISAVNAQPWHVTVVSGEPLEIIRAENVWHWEHGNLPQMSYENIRGVYHERRVAIAKQLLQSMQISRDDRERRNWWLERGYRFFDAPVALILHMDDSLDETTYRFDMGCLAQNICLAAMEFGLGTCVEYQGISYPDVIREKLHIPENHKIVCGIALGYPDQDFPANNVISERADLKNITTWLGFPSGQER